MSSSILVWQGELERSERELRRVNVELGKTKTSHQQTLAHLLDMEKALSVREKELKDSQQKLADLDVSLVSIQEERSVQEYALYKLQKQMNASGEKYSEEIENLQSLVSELEHQNSALNEELAAVKPREPTAGQKNGILQVHQAQDLQDEAHQTQKALETAQKEIVTLKNRLLRMEAKEEVLLEEKERLQEAVDQSSLELMECTDELKLAKENQDKAMSELSFLREHAQQTSATVDQLREENKDLGERVNKADTELTRAIEENELFKRESSSIQAALNLKITTLEEELRVSEKAERELNQELIAIRDAANSATTRLTQAFQEVDRLESELKEHKNTRQMVRKHDMHANHWYKQECCVNNMRTVGCIHVFLVHANGLLQYSP